MSSVYINVTTRNCSDFSIVLVINLAQNWEVNNQGLFFIPSCMSLSATAK